MRRRSLAERRALKDPLHSKLHRLDETLLWSVPLAPLVVLDVSGSLSLAGRAGPCHAADHVSRNEMRG